MAHICNSWADPHEAKTAKKSDVSSLVPHDYGETKSAKIHNSTKETNIFGMNE